MEWKLEAVPVPVSDVDRAKVFYGEQVGFAVDIDRELPGGRRLVQLTPPGSGCSIHLVTDGEPGSVKGLTLVVGDIEAAHAELAGRGVPVSDVVHIEDGERRPGRGEKPWSTMIFFSDPDDNRWVVQERPAPAA
ncbi:VOC family protein [Actinomadura keratinilytica]|uniref:VOC family protein n=1 Tax=Actinomadura keratinilytica TaxID=547461 RepID=A0ABP7YUA0_9ACTN